MLTDPQRLFVAALRSKEFKQGFKALKQLVQAPGHSQTVNAKLAYCCLGVGCEIYHKETGKGLWINAVGDGFNGWVFSDGQGEIGSSYFTPQVAEWLGLGECNPYLSGRGEHGERYANPASLLNDSTELPFETIADLFEKKFEEVNARAAANG